MIISSIGQKVLVPHTQLRPAQVRYSPEMLESKNVTVEDEVYRGGSLLKVISVQGAEPFYSLIDHHHHVLKALQKGAKIFEVLIEDIWSEDQYHQQLQQSQKEFSLNLPFYCRSLTGKWGNPFSSMNGLLEHGDQDSLRAFMGNTKVHERYENGSLIDRSILHTPYIWKKIMGTPPKNLIPTPPFAEFILGDILRSFDFPEGSRDPNLARQYLLQAKNSLPKPFKEWQNFHLDWLEVL